MKIKYGKNEDGERVPFLFLDGKDPMELSDFDRKLIQTNVGNPESLAEVIARIEKEHNYFATR